MKLEGVTLELDDSFVSLEDLALQLQKYTTQVLLVKNETTLEICDLADVEPLKEWVHKDTIKSEHGATHILRRISRDTGLDDASFDSDEDDTIVVFREDAFKALTAPKVKAAKVKAKKSK